MSGGEMTVTEPAETEFTAVYHQYGPHRAGLPNLFTYFRELWRRRTFAAEMSKASMRGANSLTFFGQAWLVLNPLLMAGVYFLLVTIIGRGGGGMDYFTHLTGSLFVFTFVQSSVTQGSTSVTTSGKLLLNTAFPRLLIPLSAVRTAFFRFLPTVPVYLVFHALAGNRWGVKQLLALFFLFTMVVFGMGLAAFFATAQIYFRDTSSFLPYFLRLWMYLSPVLWLPDSLPNALPSWIKAMIQANPMYSMLGGYTEALLEVKVPPMSMWVTSSIWAGAVAVLGFLFFISRERDFAVRIV